MIKRLKIKFILINMLFVSVVMIAAFVIMYINTASNLEKDSLSAMHEMADRKPDEHNPHLPPQKPFRDHLSHLTTYSINYNSKLDEYHIEGSKENDELSESDLEYINDIISTVNSYKENEGVLSEFNLRFLRIKTPDGLRIILLDKSYETDALNRLSLSFLLGCSIAFILFLFISIILAHIAIKPVEESVVKQKQLISDVSHELKTPITIITTNADIVLSHDDSTVKNEQKWLGYIKDEAQRMSTLVNMMLFLAKTDEAHSKPNTTRFDLSNATYEMALPFESVCFENAKIFNIDVDSDIFIKGDESSIKQLIAILLDNAIKYSDENGKIDLSLHKHGDKAIVTVFNTGEYIPKDKLPKLFDRFYRIEQSRTRDKGGSGLGLSIAKRIVEENDGTISVASDKERGTTFKCTFDLQKQKHQP